MSDQQITRTLVESNPRINLIDSDPENNIDLFCYDTCEQNDDEFIKSCRGVIFHKDTLIRKGFPYTYEYTERNNKAEIDDLLNNNLCRIYDAFEGTLLRLFCFNNKWYISTNRKLDAYKSKWGCQTSFGDLFIQALKYEITVSETFRNFIGISIYEDLSQDDIMTKFLNILNPEKQYMLFLLSTQNRIVCQYDHPKFLHVGTFFNGNLLLGYENIGLDSPKQHFFENIDQMYHYINNVDFSLLQGVIVFAPNNKQYKIFNQNYIDLYNIRGNEASIKFRYLQIRNDPIKKNILRKLYPEWCATFDMYDNCIQKICNNILQGYINRYIRKQFTTLPLEQFIIMSEVHKWHVQDRENNKINFDVVMNTLNKQKPSNINHMIKKFIAEK
jgi:hypothetical protein